MYIGFFFQCLLCLFLSYTAVVSAYLSFFKNSHFSFLTVFFVLTLVSFVVFSLYSICKLSKKVLSEKQFVNRVTKNPALLTKQFFKSNNKFLAVFAIGLISLLVAFFNVYTQYSRGMFFDELTQFLGSINRSNIIEASSRQQQPPLDYYFSAFSNELWEQTSKFSIRFHTILFYLILSFILPLGIYRFSSSLWITTVGTVIFLINHLIRLLSVYARPQSLALLTGFLFLFFYLSYCNKSRSDRQSLFPVIASQYLFVMSIGLQPVVFIVSLFLSSFWLFFDNKKTIFKNLFVSHFITALFVLPFYINMYFIGNSRYKFKTISLEAISNYILNYNIFDLFKNYFFPFYEQLSPLLLPLVVSLGAVVFIRKKISKLTIMIGSALVSFPILYDFLFHTAIRNDLNNRYFIILSLFPILFIALALKEIHQYLKTVKWKILWLIPMAILFSWAVYLQILAIKNETRFEFPYLNNNMEKVYKYLKKKGNSNDLAIDIFLKPILRSVITHTYYNKILFYESSLHPTIIKPKGIKIRMKYKSAGRGAFPIYYIKWKKFSKKEKQKIFFIVKDVDNTSYPDKAYDVLSGFMESQRFGEYAVFELTLKGKNKQKEYINFLYGLIEKTETKYRVILYETLLYYACKNKDRKKFKQLLKEYRELEPALDEISPKHNFPGYFELRRRVKYFENTHCNKD